MKNIRVADKWEIVISKDLFFKLAQEAYWYTKLAIEHAGSRSEALMLIHDYVASEDGIKTACCKNGISYKCYVTGQEEEFINLVEKKFPLVDEPSESEIITDGQVPF